MKRLLWWCLAAASLHAFDYGLSPVRVDEGIYCFFGKPEVINSANNGNMVNSCYIDTGRSWLVIDSGPTRAYAEEAVARVQALKAQPVAMVIDTHVHDDHWLGNGYFEAQGIEVIGPALFKEAVNPSESTRMQRRVSEAAYAGTEVRLPTRYVDANVSLTVDGEEIRLVRAPRPAHTTEDFLVYLPARGTLFAGDLVFNDRVLSLRDGNIDGWIASLEMIRAMPLKHVIGGHGTRTDTASADATYRYLTELRARVVEAIDDDIGIAEATRSIQLDDFRTTALYDEMHAQNVEKAYRTLEWENE